MKKYTKRKELEPITKEQDRVTGTKKVVLSRFSKYKFLIILI
jgi:hypothetical protein